MVVGEVKKIKGILVSLPILNGKFILADGIDRIDSAIEFYTSYLEVERPYNMDFGATMLSYLQKSTSRLQADKSFNLKTIKDEIEEYIPNLTILALDYENLTADRKTGVFYMEYEYTEPDFIEKIQTNFAKFVDA